MQLSKTHKILFLSLVVMCVCCCFPVAAYAPSLTKENTQEYNDQESLQIEKFELRKLLKEQQAKKLYYNIPLPQKIQDYIFDLCKQYDLSIPLVIAVIDLETGGTFDNNLRNKNTNGTIDIGLMQLNSSNFKWFGEMINEPNFNPRDIYQNLRVGIKYLSILKEGLKDKYSDEELKIRFLNQYNMGVVGYQKYIRQTGKISRAYSKRILEKRNKYRSERDDGNAIDVR